MVIWALWRSTLQRRFDFKANLRQRQEAVNKAVNKDEPTKIHGLTVEDYQKVYHSVVDHMLCQSSGQPHQYSVALGRKIKARLWEELFCPGLREVIKPSGRVLVEELLSIPGQNSCPPMIDLDISGEPVPLVPLLKAP
ncbi:hypothetical protein GN956_G1265 [Arapaima gigas]